MRAHEDCRPAASSPMIFLHDLRASFRTLLRQPLFTAVVVLVLGLGIGANTAVFSVINAVLLRPLTYPEPDRLIRLSESNASYPSFSVSVPDYLDWRAAQKGFTDLAISDHGPFTVSFAQGTKTFPERIDGASVSANFLTVLGLHPELGRDFTEAEDTPGGPLVVLIGDALWRRRFNADPNVVGERLLVNGRLREIVGVLPATLQYPRGAEILVPMGDDRLLPDALSREAHNGRSVLGRLKPGTTLEAAAADLGGIARTLAERYPASNAGNGVDARCLLDASVGEYRRSLYLLLGAVACVLLIACANVANLQLARANARRRELTVRVALGASRGRLVRQLLTESLLLGAVGGVAGALLALWSLDAIIALAPADVPRFREASLDWQSLLFAALAALGSGLLAGVWPAWRISQTVALGTALHEGSARGGSGTAAQGRMRAALVVAQLALAVVLLAGAGLTIKSFWQVMNTSFGFERRGLLIMSLGLPASHYPKGTAAPFYDQLLDRLRALPGVASAATGVNIPFGRSDWESFVHVTGTPPDLPGKAPSAEIDYVTPDYFRTMGMPIVRGRDFGPADGAPQATTVIIDERMAQRFFPGKDPIGQRLDQTDPDSKDRPPMTVVGVVGHIRHRAPGELSYMENFPQMYAGAAQIDWGGRFLVVRAAAGDPLRLAASVRQVVASMDPDLAVAEVATMEQSVSAAMASQRLTLVLLGSFAALALILAALGLYGVMALGVAQRTRELGIRMALGAGRPAVLRMVLGQSARLIGIGLVLGVAAALGAGHLLARVVYGTAAVDPGVLLEVSLLLGAIGLLASYLPARRATRIDPLVALREE